MNTSMSGRMAAALSCLVLAACGGSDDSAPPVIPPVTPPTALPTSVTISGPASVEAGGPASVSSSLTTTTGITFSWDFGDGSAKASSATAVHSYASAGDYTVTLAVTNTAGESRTATLPLKTRHFSNVNQLACSRDGFAGWCWQDIRTTPHRISQWFFVDKNVGWGVGVDGVILHTTDGGTSWQAQDSGTTDYLVDVRFRDATHGLVLTGSLGVALQTADGGVTWTHNSLGNLMPAANGADTILRDDSNAIVIRRQSFDDVNGSLTISSLDGGATWTLVPLAPNIIAGADCWAFGGAFIVRSAGCGATTATVDFPINGVFPPTFAVGSMGDASNGLFIGLDPATGLPLAWSTADAGATWSTFQPTGVPLLGNDALTMVDARHGWIKDTASMAIFSDGTTATRYTTDGGHTWTPVVLPADLLTVTSPNGLTSGILATTGRAWFAADNRLASTLDGGATWQETSVPAEAVDFSVQTVNLVVVSWPDANDIVVSADGRLYATHDGGTTWTHAVGPDARDALAWGTALWFTDATHGVMALDDGAIKTTADGGQTWSRKAIATTPGMPVALRFNAAGDGWLLMGGTLSRSADQGATWTPLSTSLAMNGLLGMSWADAQHAWAWGPAAIFATADGGATWQSTPLPAGGAAIASLAFSTSTTGVLIDANGTLLRSVDGGTTWGAVAGPGIGGRLVHTGGHVLWIVSDSVARSTDDGATWTVVSVPAIGGFNDITFADDQHGWMSSYYGVIASTTDGGATWTASNVGGDILVTSIFASDDFTSWGGTSTGSLLATATGGR